MKTEVSNEFILHAYEHACPECKEKIKNECPELFKSKLEHEKWYKGTSSLGTPFLGVYDEKQKSIMYGFWNKNWCDNKNGLIEVREALNLEIATEKEVGEALIKEAEKKEFKEGITIKSLLQNEYQEIILKGKSFIYFSDDNTFYMSKFGCIFKKGKWATIISNPVEEKIKELEKEINELRKQL